MTTLVQKKRTSAIVMALVAAGMLALGFAAVPLYRMFCQVTGFNGTTQRAVPGRSVQVAAGHTMSIRFDSNVTPGRPWKFYHEHPTNKLTGGARDMTIFIPQNKSDKTIPET